MMIAPLPPVTSAQIAVRDSLGDAGGSNVMQIEVKCSKCGRKIRIFADMTKNKPHKLHS